MPCCPTKGGWPSPIQPPDVAVLLDPLLAVNRLARAVIVGHLLRAVPAAAVLAWPHRRAVRGAGGRVAVAVALAAPVAPAAVGRGLCAGPF